MSSSQNILVHFVLLCCAGAAPGPRTAPRHVAPADTILHVVNEIFSSLKIKVNGNSNKQELPTHNYFVGFSEYKSDNWKEIVRLTSFDIKMANSSTDYTTTVINKVLNGENKTGKEIDIHNGDAKNKKRKNFLRKLKEVYLRNIPYRTLNNNKPSNLFPKGRTSHSTYNKNTVAGKLNLAHNGTKDIEVWVPTSSRRIFQGRETRIYYYPFVASIHIFAQFTCAGSIIAGDLVITAASCLQLAHNNRFYRENPQFLAVRVGSSFYSGAGDLIPVLEVYFHPLYDPQTLNNNLAIMRLQRYIFFKDRSRVKKVNIDKNANALPLNTNGIVIVGWGAKTASNKVKNPMVSKIAVSVLDFYPLRECREIYSKTFVTDRHFCAGFFTRGGGACNRDVGAPGLVGGLLAGVVSFGSTSCGAADTPTVFTKLGFYVDWIEEIMAQDKSEFVNKILATHRPHPIRTVKTTSWKPLEFVIEPISHVERTGYDQDSKELLRSTNQRHPLVSDVSNEEPNSYEQQFANKEQMEDGNIELAQSSKKNTQEHADLSPAQYIPSDAAIQNYILREKLSQFTALDKLPQTSKVTTTSDVVEQLPKPVNSKGLVGLPRDEEYIKATTTETKLNSVQFVQLDMMDSEIIDKLLNKVNSKLDTKYTKTDKLPEIDKIKIKTSEVVPEQQAMKRHIDLSEFKKDTEFEFVSLDTKEDSFVVDNKSLSEVDEDYAMIHNSIAATSPDLFVHDKMNAYEVTQLQQIKKQHNKSSEGKILKRTPHEKVADPPTIEERDLIEQPEVTFSDPALNQQINELIDYMNIIDAVSKEQE